MAKEQFDEKGLENIAIATVEKAREDYLEARYRKEKNERIALDLQLKILDAGDIVVAERKSSRQMR